MSAIFIFTTKEPASHRPKSFITPNLVFLVFNGDLKTAQVYVYAVRIRSCLDFGA
jgi:hypothetical protein